MAKSYPPKYKQDHFNCIKCGVYAKQTWGDLYIGTTQSFFKTNFERSKCSHCEEACYWHDGRMIIPSESPAPAPSPDLPRSCLDAYDEARDIVARSPKAGAALIRIVLQKLFRELGQSGENFEADISALIARGLPAEMQRALEFSRVIGADAVKPGEISLQDNTEIAYTLFQVINFIVDALISQPNKLNDLYEKLPEGAKNVAVERNVKLIEHKSQPPQPLRQQQQSKPPPPQQPKPAPQPQKLQQSRKPQQKQLQQPAKKTDKPTAAKKKLSIVEPKYPS